MGGRWLAGGGGNGRPLCWRTVTAEDDAVLDPERVVEVDKCDAEGSLSFVFSELI